MYKTKEVSTCLSKTFWSVNYFKIWNANFKFRSIQEI